MIITLNGARTDVADGVTVQVLITDHVGSTRGSAVVLDGEVVPRSAWPERALTAGADVEIVTAVQGG